MTKENAELLAALVLMIASLSMARRLSDNATVTACIQAGNPPEQCAALVRGELKLTFRQEPKR